MAPEMFHQTISAILLRIYNFFRTPYERRGIAGQWNRGIIIWTDISFGSVAFIWEQFDRECPR